MKLESFSGDRGSSKRRLGSQRPCYRRVLHINYICIWHFSSNFTCVLEAGCSLVPACLFAFSHRCININPAVFSSLWRKHGFSFSLFETASGTLCFLRALSIAFILIFSVNSCIFHAEMRPIFRSVRMFPGWSLSHYDLPWNRQWISRSMFFMIKFYYQRFLPS